MVHLLLATMAVALPNFAQARVSVALDSAVFVERGGRANGRMLEPARRLSRGDRVVYIVTWTRQAGDGGFVVTNPLPRTVYYQASADDSEQVSIDGGRTWGRLDDLRIGTRLATPEDVTHVRWRIPAPVAARGSGQIAYSAIVR
ncbi:hypothetical protein [Novosphingobium kunmingense]|nr:hypothetical protein [Novosphingobium kunmingense]